MAQFLNPMNDLVDSVSAHRKFRGPHAGKEQVEAELRRLKRENPKQVRRAEGRGWVWVWVCGCFYVCPRPSAGSDDVRPDLVVACTTPPSLASFLTLQVFYLFYPDVKRPGMFKMAHLIKTQIFSEPVDVTPRYAVIHP